MSKKIITLNNGKQEAVSPIVASAGAVDAGKAVGLDGNGRLDPTVMPAGIGSTTFVYQANEDLTAGNLVNVFDDAGTIKVRKADAADPTKPAVGFVKAAVTAGGNATVYLEGENNSLSGLTVGSDYFLSDTPGQATTSPSETANHIVQSIGFAISSTSLMFVRKEPILLK